MLTRTQLPNIGVTETSREKITIQRTTPDPLDRGDDWTGLKKRGDHRVGHKLRVCVTCIRVDGGFWDRWLRTSLQVLLCSLLLSWEVQTWRNRASYRNPDISGTTLTQTWMEVTELFQLTISRFLVGLISFPLQPMVIEGQTVLHPVKLSPILAFPWIHNKDVIRKRNVKTVESLSIFPGELTFLPGRFLKMYT